MAQIPAALSEAETVFASAALDTDDGVQAAMAIAAAATIVEIAHQTAEGFGNLRFAAAARCPPGIRSFPWRITTAVRPRWPWPSRRPISRRRRSPRRRASPRPRHGSWPRWRTEGGRLARTAESLCATRGWRFGGIDLSLAPFPDAPNSVVGALERLGLAPFGAFGTLFAVRCLTAALQRAR